MPNTAPRGAAPLIVGVLGLTALGTAQLLPVRHSAESDLRARSLNALDQAGLSQVTVDFTGQDGVLHGSASSSADAQRAADVVRTVTGVRMVTSRLAVPPSPSATAPSTSAPSTPAPSTPAPSTPAPSTPAPSTGPGESGTTPRTEQRATVQALLDALPEIRFAFASARLTPAGRSSAARAAAALDAAPELRIRIDGYTDDIGDWQRNLALSRRRAEAVRRTLIANGIPASRITVLGWSEDRPVAPNTSPAGRALNRRVEIVVS